MRYWNKLNGVQKVFVVALVILALMVVGWYGGYWAK